MHLIECYALSCGLKIEKPYIEEESVENLPEKFILFNPHTKGIDKNYNKWQEVIKLLENFLNVKNIKIIQVDNQEFEYDGCIKVKNISWNQTAYITKKAIMLLGIDSFCMHLAGFYEKPMVIIWGAGSGFNNCRPYFGDYSNFKFFIPFLGKRKPSYGSESGEEYINQFNPKEIADKVIEILNSNKL